MTEQTIEMINQACDDMVEAYATLAELAAPAMEELDTTVGRIKQWRYTTQQHGGELVEYSDTPWSGWKKMFVTAFVGHVTEERVPHPQADEARARVAELLDLAGTNDDQFALDMTDLAETPRAIGRLITDWLAIRDDFTNEVSVAIPADAAFIPTTGGLGGWSSPTATDAYGAVVGSQDSAAGVARDVMSGLIDNSAAFLASLQESLAAFAQLTLDLDAYYSDLIGKGSGIVTGLADPSFGAVADVIDFGFTAVNGLREQEVATAEAFGTMLNSTIQSLLAIETLSNDIDDMGQTAGERGWPAPVAVTYADEGEPTDAQLVSNAQYFLDHSRFWTEVASALNGLSLRAGSTPDLPVMYGRVPTFSADQSVALNALGDRLAHDVLSRGSTQTSEIGNKLLAVMDTYLSTEADNAAHIDRVREQIGA